MEVSDVKMSVIGFGVYSWEAMLSLLKGISQCVVGEGLLGEKVDLNSVTDMGLLRLKDGPL
jgi:hypothetical protein